VKRQALVSKIRKAAKMADLKWEMVREGSNHEVWQCGTTKVSIPRHREVNEITAENILKDLGDELGEDWWR